MQTVPIAEVGSYWRKKSNGRLLCIQWTKELFLFALCICIVMVWHLQPICGLHIVLVLILCFPLECQTNYHHNFKVKDGVRTYYDGIPLIIQVGEHQFAEKRLIQLWITMMLVSWQVFVLLVYILCTFSFKFLEQDFGYKLCAVIQSLIFACRSPFRLGFWIFSHHRTCLGCICNSGPLRGPRESIKDLHSATCRWTKGSFHRCTPCSEPSLSSSWATWAASLLQQMSTRLQRWKKSLGRCHWWSHHRLPMLWDS